MAEPQAYEPEKLTSGVTWKWKKTISDYPASEWTLTYYLRKDGATVLKVVDSQDAHNSSQGRVIPARRNIEQTILLCHIHSPVFLADLLVDVSTENFNKI